MSAPPRVSVSRPLPRVRRCSDRRNDREQNGREDRGSNQDAHAVRKLLHPRQEYLPSLVVACGRPALLESSGNFGTVADP
jgi:hypothetical protein